MKTPDDIARLTLTFICKDEDSFGDKDCATIYQTNRPSWVVQGDRRDEPEIVDQARAFAVGREGLVEIPEALIDPFVRIYVRERYGIDLGEAEERPDRRSA